MRHEGTLYQGYLCKPNYLWNFKLTKFDSQAVVRHSKVENMLEEVRKKRDDAVSNKKKEQMMLATDYISNKNTMSFASTQLKGMGTQTVSQMYATQPAGST